MACSARDAHLRRGNELQPATIFGNREQQLAAAGGGLRHAALCIQRSCVHGLRQGHAAHDLHAHGGCTAWRSATGGRGSVNIGPPAPRTAPDLTPAQSRGRLVASQRSCGCVSSLPPLTRLALPASSVTTPRSPSSRSMWRSFVCIKLISGSSSPPVWPLVRLDPLLLIIAGAARLQARFRMYDKLLKLKERKVQQRRPSSLSSTAAYERCPALPLSKDL
jgi:hypothetical protein